jgi:cell division septation protein DedD
MKRFIIFSLFCAIFAFFSFTPVFAQEEEGNATWYRSTSANLHASHAKLPIGTKLKVTCLENDKVVYVTVSDRIPNGSEWILDISQAAAEVLEITDYEYAVVKIEVVRDIPGDEAHVTAVADAERQHVVEPVHEDVIEITIVPAAIEPAYGDIPEISAVPAQPAPQSSPQAPVRTTVPSATINNQPIVVMPPTDSGSQVTIKVNVNINGKEHVFEVAPPSNQVEGQTVPDRNTVTATPSLPPTVGRKIYRIQVGSFSNPAFAQDFFDKLKNAGFTPSIERYGSLYRVVISGVNDAEIPLFVERLGIAGFTDVWIREEK